MYQDDFLQPKLAERHANNAYRVLRLPSNKVDFCSNDYLGIATNNLLNGEGGSEPAGAMGSRLLSGNYPLIEHVEKQIAAFHDAEAALLFNSGYDANLGLLSTVPQRGDTVLYDMLSHASIRDGIRLSFAQSHAYAHNDLNDLTTKLKATSGTIFIVTESVFSMDGDMADIVSLVALAQQYKAHLIIDEAHATGVVGERGEGLVQLTGMQQNVFARMHTFGKALGCHGAVVLGSEQLRNYLINFARTFIFSTALPPAAVAAIKKSYELFPTMQAERKQVEILINCFQKANLVYEKLVSNTPIQIIIIPGNQIVKSVAEQLQKEGVDVRPILYPTVPKGKERLRIILHAFNTEEQVKKIISLLQ